MGSFAARAKYILPNMKLLINSFLAGLYARGYCLAILLLLVFPAMAQKKIAGISEGSDKIPVFFEKVYLHTDRDHYSAAEDIWFNAYLVNGKSAYLTASSNNLYVELISPTQQLLDRKVIRLEKGVGKGDFQLADSLSEGWYQLRAYTNWMRNFEDNFVFQKKVYVAANLKVIDNSGRGQKTPANKETLAGQKTDAADQVIQFFPEGGALVIGNQGLVAFKAEDARGQGVKASGKVISPSGQVLTSFESTDLGMGLFTITPRPNEEYRVEGTYANGKSFQTTLPNALSKGISLHLSTDSLGMKCLVVVNEGLFNELNGKEISLQLKHAGDVVYSSKIKMSSAQVTLKLAYAGLPPGISTLTLFDHQGRPQCERLTYVPHPEMKLSITPNQKTFTAGKSAQITLDLKNAKGQAQQASLSLAVVDGIVPVQESHIITYLMLESELKGTIQDPGRYFDQSNSNRLKQLDLLLLTQGWRDYLWKKMPAVIPKISYLPEPGITLSGNVRQKIGNNPLPNMNITLFANGFEGNKIYTTRTNAKGNYFFDGLNWSGEQDLRLNVVDDKGKAAGWIQLDSVFKGPMAIKPFYQQETTIDALSFKDANLKRMAAHLRFKSKAIELKEVEIAADRSLRTETEILTSFGFPDHSYEIKAKDHEFRDLQHFIVTKVPGARALSDSAVGVAFISRGKEVKPRLMVNKREDMFERVDYYGLSMEQVNKVTVKHLINIDGNDAYVIGLDLKETAFGGNNLHLLNKTLEGYYSARAFYSPSFIGGDGTSEDLRTTVFWAPLLKTNAQGQVKVSFKNAEPRGNVNVFAEGITDTGIPIRAYLKYKVQ